MRQNARLSFLLIDDFEGSAEPEIRQHRQSFGIDFNELEREQLGEAARIDEQASGHVHKRSLLAVGQKLVRHGGARK